MSNVLTAGALRDRLKAISRPMPAGVTTKSAGILYVRELTGSEMDYLVNRPDGLRRTEFVTRSLCDETGEPLLDGDDTANVNLVGGMPNGDLQLLFKKVREINGLNADETSEDGTPGPTVAS